ncbi:MAG: non-hydrolyzing UDP-N-acetylglucosamine 2-epimerase [Candidatus Acidiferrales bacterium]
MSLKTFEQSDLTPKICVVLGTRPGIVKMSPIIRALTTQKASFFCVHTGQHYSYQMDRVFFEELGLPDPTYRVVETQNHPTHAGQTAEMMKGIEVALISARPRVVLVGGDANTNLAGALAARKLGMILGHVEAGLRSRDWRMPEEHNRTMIDHISDLLLAPTDFAASNLRQESVRGNIFVVGNTIVDAVGQHSALAAQKSQVLDKLGLQSGRYTILTVHREENVDSRENLKRIADIVTRLSAEKVSECIVFPMHPRTRERLASAGFLESFSRLPGLMMTEPYGYLDFLALLSSAAIILTDSGGLQEEACILRVPCVTLRENTERPETVTVGANIIAGLDAKSVMSAIVTSLAKPREWSQPLGDGRAGERIARIAMDAAAGKGLPQPECDTLPV